VTPAGELPSVAGSVRSVRVRLLPWRPRWRTRDPDLDFFDVPGFDAFDDLAGVVLVVLLLLVAPFLLLFLVGVVLLSAELLLLLALVPLLMTGQLLCLLPWVLVVTAWDGERYPVEARGTRAMVRARRYYRALR
jgi:hypothetical protein